MGATSRSHKPNEWAAKINHTHIIILNSFEIFVFETSFVFI